MDGIHDREVACASAGFVMRRGQQRARAMRSRAAERARRAIAGECVRRDAVNSPRRRWDDDVAGVSIDPSRVEEAGETSWRTAREPVRAAARSVDPSAARAQRPCFQVRALHRGRADRVVWSEWMKENRAPRCGQPIASWGTGNVSCRT